MAHTVKAEIRKECVCEDENYIDEVLSEGDKNSERYMGCLIVYETSILGDTSGRKTKEACLLQCNDALLDRDTSKSYINHIFLFRQFVASVKEVCSVLPPSTDVELVDICKRSFSSFSMKATTRIYKGKGLVVVYLDDHKTFKLLAIRDRLVKPALKKEPVLMYSCLRCITTMCDG